MMAWYAPNAAAGSDGSGRPISEVGPGIPSEDGYKERYEELMGIPPPTHTPPHTHTPRRAPPVPRAVRLNVSVPCAGMEPLPESTWQFMKAFQVFRLAAIGHGVFARGLQGNASSTKATGQGWRASSAQAMLIELGLETSPKL